MERSHFKWNAPKKSKKEILRILKIAQHKLTGAFDYGNAVESEWADGMHDCITFKTAKLNDKGFQRFPQNWLLVYDNLRSAGINDSIACQNLLNLLENYWQIKSTGQSMYDRVFIQSEKHLVSFEKNLLNTYEIKDLWL